MKDTTTIQTTVHSPMSTIWETWTQPQHIQQWNHASDDWYCPKATNNLQEGQRFSYFLSSKDDKVSFEVAGRYDRIMLHQLIEYTMDDGRRVITHFKDNQDSVDIITTFELETENTKQVQHDGWQAILDNFKIYVENR